MSLVLNDYDLNYRMVDGTEGENEIVSADIDGPPENPAKKSFMDRLLGKTNLILMAGLALSVGFLFFTKSKK